jgi:hypothetical protein
VQSGRNLPDILLSFAGWKIKLAVYVTLVTSLLFDPEDGGCMFLRNISKLLVNYILFIFYLTMM